MQLLVQKLNINFLFRLNEHRKLVYTFSIFSIQDSLSEVMTNKKYAAFHDVLVENENVLNNKYGKILGQTRALQ